MPHGAPASLSPSPFALYPLISAAPFWLRGVGTPITLGQSAKPPHHVQHNNNALIIIIKHHLKHPSQSPLCNNGLPYLSIIFPASSGQSLRKMCEVSIQSQMITTFSYNLYYFLSTVFDIINLII